MFSVVIPAAGSGTRMDQSLPKALTPFKGSTFLEWQIKKFENISDQIYVIVSENQYQLFKSHRDLNNLSYNIIIQNDGKGSFFAIKSVISQIKSKFLLICWVDQIGLSRSMILHTVTQFLITDCAALIPLIYQKEPYVKAVIGPNSKLISWEYRREGDLPKEGYTDLGFFAFQTASLKKCIDSIEDEKSFTSRFTKEFNFLDALPYFSQTFLLEFLYTFDELNTVAVNTKSELAQSEKIITKDRLKTLYSIIIPSYNEAKQLPKLLQELNVLYFGNKGNKDYKLEIIFVDDGSSDNTHKILLNYSFNYLYQQNSGKGAAVKLGTKNAKGDYILVLDADGEYLISDIPRLVEFSLKNPISVIYGSRYLTGKTIKVRMLPISGQSVLNLYFNYFLSFLILFRFRVIITDSLTGYKIYHRELYNKVNPTTKGFETDHELSKQILKWRIKINEYQITYLPRSKKDGKKISTTDAFKALIMWLK